MLSLHIESTNSMIWWQITTLCLTNTQKVSLVPRSTCGIAKKGPRDTWPVFPHVLSKHYDMFGEGHGSGVIEYCWSCFRLSPVNKSLIYDVSTTLWQSSSGNT